MEWATPINTLLNWWAPPERTGSASEDDWVIISDSKPLDLEIKRSITPFLPLKSPEKFEAYLAKFSKMVLMRPLRENRFSITIAAGILCIIHSIAKKSLQRYINRAEKLPRPNIPVRA